MPNALKELQVKAHNTARAKGFYDEDERNVPEVIALIHSEASEALEDYRKGRMNVRFRRGDKKPEGFGIELADILIRVFDLAEYLGINLDEAVAAKMQYNEGREYKHGKKC